MGELARMLEGAEDDKDSNQRVKFAGVIAEQRGLLKSDSKEIGKIVIQRQVAKNVWFASLFRRAGLWAITWIPSLLLEAARGYDVANKS